MYAIRSYYDLDRPEARRVTFYTARNNIFYLELAIDHTEFSYNFV